MKLIPTRPQLFFTKNDPQDIRLGEIAKSIDVTNLEKTNPSWVVIGYPDDDGIRLNGGRPGSAEAPRTIRQFLYKMTPPPLKTDFKIVDLGDLEPVGDLAVRHQAASDVTKQVFENKGRLLSFGGGHDYGFPDCDSFVTAFKNGSEKPVVINFDAHLDVRPTNNGLNSGTPFYRLLEKHSDSFQFIEIGLQPQCNSWHHWKWAEDKGAFLFSLSDIEKNQGLDQLWNLAPLNKITPSTPVFLSFDIDALVSSEAGGCSQAWATGLSTKECLKFISILKQKTDLKGLGIYEVSPPLDTDFRTSKTAALLSYYTLFQ